MDVESTILRRLLYIGLASCAASCASVGPDSFETPEEAMRAVAEIAGTDDADGAEELFGPGGIELLRSGDEVADHEDALRVKEAIHERLAFEDGEAGTKIALLGDDGWPFPIPLVLADDRWQFDVEAGVEELENRRVGRNELLTLATMHAYVDAQREYISASRDGRPAAYAQKVISSEGSHDGLYWPVAENEPESPLGPLVAAATSEGYATSGDEPIPYHGYHYRILKGQGRSAPGGERSYMDSRGNMTRGFALVCWPAKYGSSGVMTFQVNQMGIVYQKDLGPDTEAAARAIELYDPDESWEPTGD